jgi:hypothetical protein
MNKKNVMISIMLMLSLMESVCANDARAIRKDLQEKYAQGLLNECQLMEDGLTFAEVLDRDIKIIEDHKTVLNWRIDGYKHVFARSVVPFIKGLGAVIFGTVSAGTGLFAVGGTTWSNNVWNGQEDFRIKITDFVVKTGSSWGFLNSNQVAKYNLEKCEVISKNNPGFKEITLAAPVAGAISFLTGLLFIKAAISTYKHHDRLDESIAKWKKRIQRDNGIIVALKQLKYNNAQ